jgi:hypothetical protein
MSEPMPHRSVETVKAFLDRIEAIAFTIPAPNSFTPLIAQLCIAARNDLTHGLAQASADTKDVVKLGYELNEALGRYLDAKTIATDAGYEGYEVQAQSELLQIMWDNKAGIIAHLLNGFAQAQPERIAELQSEAGFYQCLYESAIKRFERIAIVCTDNMDRDCDHRMALDFVRQIANDALTLPSTNRLCPDCGRSVDGPTHAAYCVVSRPHGEVGS